MTDRDGKGGGVRGSAAVLVPENDIKVCDAVIVRNL